MNFSERIGKKQVKIDLQIGSIDDDLMNRLWNTFIDSFMNKVDDNLSINQDSNRPKVCKYIWKEFFNNIVDDIPEDYSGRVSTSGTLDYIKKWFFETADWDEIYCFIEFIVSMNSMVPTRFVEHCNWALKKEVSGYRIIDGLLVQVNSAEEIQAIEEAILKSDKFKSVNAHLKTAVNLLSDRKTPNYRNSVKESVSAVEALCKIITNDDKATLGKALSEIEKTYKLHPALKKGFSAIYGYTSDKGGIRHSLLEDGAIVDFEEAKFMLVTCSAFINYLIMKIK